MKKYKTDSGIQIREIEVIRETEQSVVFMLLWAGNTSRERMERKETGYHRWHDTWEAAHACILHRAATKLESARRNLQRAQDELGNVKGMKKPETAN